MADDTQRLIVSIEAKVDKLQKALDKASGITSARAKQIESRFAKMSDNLRNSASGTAASIGNVFAGLGAYLSADALVDYANEWTRLTRSIDASSDTFGIALRPASDLVKLANEARVDVEAYAKTYIRAAAAVRDYGFTSDDAAKATSVLSMALKLGQASASEQESTILQFSQALQKGKLDGDEFRTVMENAGVVQELLAKKLNVTKGEIINLSKAGKLQIGTLITALIDGASGIQKTFTQMPVTMDEAFAVLKNNIIEYIGNADKATGASQAVASAITGIASHLDEIAVAAGAILGSATLRMAAFAAATLAASNPLTLLASALGALAVGYEVYGDKVKLSDDGLVSLKGSISAVFDVLGDREAIDRHIAALASMTDEARKAAEAEDALRKRADLSGGGWLIHGDPTSQESIAAMKDDFGAIDKYLGGIGTKFLAWASDVAGTVADVTGLSDGLKAVEDRARNVELARKADDVRAQGFGGSGFRDYLNSNLRRTPKPQQTSPDFDKQTSQIRKRTEEIRAQIDEIDKTTFAQEKAKASADLLFAAQQGAAKNGTQVTQEQKAQIEKLASDYATASVQAKFLSDLQSERDGVDAARSETSLIGLYGQALDEAKAKLDLLNQAKKLGLTLTPDLQKQIDETAQAGAETKAYTDKVKELEDVSKDALGGFINDLRTGKSLAESFGNVLDKLAEKLVSSGVDQLVTAGSGALLGPGSGFASLFGFANGGVFVPGMGSKPLKRFAGGGVSRNAAVFGEAGPEAAVPLPDGRRIPVDLRMPAAVPANNQSSHINISVDARNSTPESIDKLNSTTLPQLQRIIDERVNYNIGRKTSTKKLIRRA